MNNLKRRFFSFRQNKSFEQAMFCSNKNLKKITECKNETIDKINKNYIINILVQG